MGRILPINKKRAITLCKCKWRSNISGQDTSGKCRWRLGSRVVDDEENDKNFSGNWYCNNPTTKPAMQVIEQKPAQSDMTKEVPVQGK